jgi:hypothetical protein
MSNNSTANQAFLKVGNLAGQVGIVNATSITAGTVVGTVSRPPFVETFYTAYAPTGLVGTASTLQLVNVSAGATTPVFSLPVGSVVIGAQVSNNGATLTSDSAANVTVGYTGATVSYAVCTTSIDDANLTSTPPVCNISRSAGLWGYTGGDAFYVLPSADLTAGDLKVVFKVLVPA